MLRIYTKKFLKKNCDIENDCEEENLADIETLSDDDKTNDDINTSNNLGIQLASFINSIENIKNQSEN